MMLICAGAVLLAWVAFIWFIDPDDVQKHTHRSSTSGIR